MDAIDYVCENEGCPYRVRVALSSITALVEWSIEGSK